MLNQHQAQHGITRVKLTGPLTRTQARATRRQLSRISGAEVGKLVVDLAAVPSIDATGLDILADTVRRLNRNGSEMVVAGINQSIHCLLELTRLDRLVEIVDQVPGVTPGAQQITE